MPDDNIAQDTAAEDVKRVLPWLKRNWHLLLLTAILIASWNIRAYHSDYPVLGYHNWKETHYLTEARNFAREGFFKYGIFVPWTDYPIGPSQEGIHPDTFPLPQIIYATLFRITGPNESIARNVSILFSVATVALAYVLGRQLFKREDAALATAALFAITPLFVFFGRQAMLDPPALFLTMLGTVLFLQWRETDKPKHLILSTIAFTLGIMTKYTFFIVAIPALALTPWQRVKEWRARIKTYAICAGIAALLPIWILYMASIPGTYGLKEAVSGETVDLNLVSDGDFWNVMKAFAADNYSPRAVLFAVLGLGMVMLTFRRNIAAKYLGIYALAAIPWFIVLAYKLEGHNYHQYPIAPLAPLLIAYLVVVIANTLKTSTKLPASNYIVAALALFLLFTPAAEGWKRQFDTQFVGLDAAGDYIRERSPADERVFHSGHQSYGVLWEADRKGEPLPAKEEDVKEHEEKYNYQWYLMYQWGFQTMQNEPVWNHIKENYHLAQAALRKQGDNYQPIYLLFRKGGTYNESKLNEYLANKPTKVYTYEFTGGTQELLTVNVE